MNSSQLSIIEPATEFSTDSSGRFCGVLILSLVGDNFFLHWGPLDNSPINKITSVFEEQGKADFRTNDWSVGKFLNVNCQELSMMYLKKHEKGTLMTFLDKTQTKKRSFITNEFISLADFIEKLLIKGIAVPSVEKMTGFSEDEPENNDQQNQEIYKFSFYEKCHKGVISYTPPFIQLEISEDMELPKFWEEVHTFYQRLINHFNISETLPKDPSFPLAIAARAAHARVYEQIEKFIKQEESKDFKQITESDWDSLFDEKGKLKDPEGFRSRIYHAGVDKSIRAKALPYVFGVYDLNMNKEERDKKKESLENEYNTLCEQLHSLQTEQIANNKKQTSFFRVISHDISRTDRQHPAFKDTKTPGLTMLEDLLKAYCVYNPPIGYLQGMNDLFVPILLAYMPDWDENGDPIDKDGKVVDYKSYMPEIFWCFDSMLRNTDHLSFLSSVTEHCQGEAEIVHQILSQISPIAAIWMKRNNLSELLWCYSDFVLLFKRSFEDIWTVWLQFNCAPAPKHWLSYFVTALIMESFNELSSLPDVTIPTVMAEFPKIMENLNHKRLGLIALWLSETYPFRDDNINSKPKDLHFDFFKPSWINDKE